MAHAARCGVGGEGHVGVGEEQDLAGGRVRPALGRMGLAEPSRREFVDVQHLEPRVPGAQAFSDLPGAVGGAVVDVDHLIVRVAQDEERLQGPFDRALLVMGGDDDGETGERGVVGAGWCDIVESRDLVVVTYGGYGEGHPCSEGEGSESEGQGSDGKCRHAGGFRP